MTHPLAAANHRSGIVPWAVVGIVQANDDPLGLGRVRVSFPTLHPGPWSFWLRMAVPMAGASSGFFALPHLGDEVLVVFLHGHHDHGVVVGQLWNGVDQPPPEALGASLTATPSDPPRREDEPAHRYVWRSRRGHLVLMDDTPGQESIRLLDRTRKLSVLLDSTTHTLHICNERGDVNVEAAGTLRLAAEGNVHIQAGQALHLSSGADTVHQTGGDYRMTAAGDAQLHAAGVFEARSTGASLKCLAATRILVEGTSATVLGRSRATLEGNVLAEVTGGSVKLN